MKKLCGSGDDALYQSRWGARTLSNIKEMEELEKKYHEKVAQERAKPKPVRIQVSWELGMANERCIDQYGCSMFEGM